MLAQLVALEGRLAKLQLAPAGVLDDVERASTWLHEKAENKVLIARKRLEEKFLETLNVEVLKPELLERSTRRRRRTSKSTSPDCSRSSG